MHGSQSLGQSDGLAELRDTRGAWCGIISIDSGPQLLDFAQGSRGDGDRTSPLVGTSVSCQWGPGEILRGATVAVGVRVVSPGEGGGDFPGLDPRILIMREKGVVWILLWGLEIPSGS